MPRSNSNALYPAGTDGMSFKSRMRDLAESTGSQHRCFAYQSGNTNMANATNTPITFTVEEGDARSWHSGVTNNTRITPDVPGRFRVTGQITFDTASGTGARIVSIRLNGTTVRGRQSVGAISGTTMSVQVYAEVPMNGSTDYVELIGYQSSGSSMITTTGIGSTWFSCERMGDL